MPDAPRIFIDSGDFEAPLGDAVLSISFLVPGQKAKLVQIRMNFDSAYTGDVYTTITKAAAYSDYSTTYEEAVVAITTYHDGLGTNINKNLPLYCQNGDSIDFSTDQKIAAGDHVYVEVVYEGSGI